MMKLMKAFALLVILLLAARPSSAQGNDQRMKIVLVVDWNGKKITSALNSFSSALTRPSTESLAIDSVGKKIAGTYGTGFYVNLDASLLSDDMVKLVARKDLKFSATITVSDNYGKLPTRTIKLTNATVYSVSDQYTTSVYGDGYGAVMVSLNCEKLSVNGVNFEL